MTVVTPPAALTMQEIYDRLVDKNDLFIVDVRNEEEFATWHIETARG
ncbi:MAG: rhodanese-like domain-containing protein, partial [Anaerolineae bacterium]|nr:rhodanese-like domain-containing protein [Anaerolineae bacterium]